MSQIQVDYRCGNKEIITVQLDGQTSFYLLTWNVFQVEYTIMDKEDPHRDNEKILSDLLQLQTKRKPAICLGNKHQVHFVYQV